MQEHNKYGWGPTESYYQGGRPWHHKSAMGDQKHAPSPAEGPQLNSGNLSNASWHTILGLILGLAGSLGVIQLRPQIVVMPQAPLVKGQPFSVPFRVDNSGYFACPVDHIFVYVHRLKSQSTDLGQTTIHEADWNHFLLERAEGKTIRVTLADFPRDDVPSEADIEVVVDYRPFEHFPASFRRYFRFEGAYGDNWQWLKQPSADIQAETDRKIAEHMRSVPSSR